MIQTKTVTVKQLNCDPANRLDEEIQRQAAKGWQMTHLTTVPLSYMVGHRSRGQLYTLVFSREVEPSLEHFYR